jgi:hypothetical protein
MPLVTYVLRPTSPTDLTQLARALERRALGLDATDAHATVRDDVIELRVTLPIRSLVNLFGDQLKRRGLFAIAAFDPDCDPFARMRLPAGIYHSYTLVDWIPRPVYFAYATAFHSTGAAPLAPLQNLVSQIAPPSEHVVLIGAMRDRAGDIARRTYCISTRGSVFGPRIAHTESTLDTETLYPLLRVHLASPDDARLEQLRSTATSGLVLAMDDEVIGLTRGRTDRGAGWLEVVPESPIPSVSPEMISGLLVGGPLPVGVEILQAR